MTGELLRQALLDHRGGRDNALHLIEATLADADADAPGLRYAAWLAFAASDPETGKTLLRRGARHPGDNGESWFALGLVRLGRGEDRGAQHCFVAASRARSRAGGVGDGVAQLLRQPTGGNRYAAIGIIYSGFEDAFTPFALPRAVTQAEQQHYGFCFDRAMSFLGRSLAADALLEADRQCNGERFWYHVNHGHRLWVGGDRDGADRHYASARAEVLEQRITPFHYNCGIIVWLSRARAVALLEADGAETTNPGWVWHPASPGPKPEGALLVGFDPGYFVFFPKFLLSAVRAYTASGVDIPFRVHCHIADAPQAMIDFVLQAAAAITARAPGFTVSISTGPSKAREAAHYTCLRYLAMPTLMRMLNCGVVAMDVDSEILPSFFEQWGRIAEHGFGLRMYSFGDDGRQLGGEPWSIGAHPTFVGDTPLGHRFAAFLRDYIETVYDPSLITNWTVDQCAIARGFDLLLRDQPFESIFNFARGAPLYRLPNDFGTKQDFLQHEPVWPTTLLALIEANFAGPA